MLQLPMPFPTIALLLVFGSRVCTGSSTKECQRHADNQALCQLPQEAQLHRASAAVLLQSQSAMQAESLLALQVDAGSREASGARLMTEMDRHQALGDEYMEHNEALQRSVIEASSSMGLSNDELDTLIKKFIDSQSTSEDKCPSQLLEAKHQMNVLHHTIHDLSFEINSTELEINKTLQEIRDIQDDIADVDKECEKRYDKCDKEREEHLKMWIKLKGELLEMYMIANPSVYMHAHDIYSAVRHGVVTNRSVKNFTIHDIANYTTNRTMEVPINSTHTFNDLGASSLIGSAPSAEYDDSSPNTYYEQIASLANDPTYDGISRDGSGVAYYDEEEAMMNSMQSPYSLLQTMVAEKHEVGLVRRHPMVAEPSASGVRDARQHARRTKQLVKDLAKCRESHQMLLEGNSSRFLASSLVQGGGPCSADMNVKITLNGKSKVVNAGKALTSGASSAVLCRSINPAMSGMVWLYCNDSHLVPDLSSCNTSTLKINSSCEEQLQDLEASFVKAYVELTRLVAQYEMLVNSTACMDAAKEECKELKQPHHDKITVLTTKLNEFYQRIEQMHTRITAATRAETQLREHIEMLSERCSAMNKTASSLDKVRDVIHLLKKCPGLRRPEFRIPLWSGQWEDVLINTEHLPDSEIDRILQSVCAARVMDGVSLRAAETAEIEQMSIQGAPLNNTASVPLMGVCPFCEGDQDDPTAGFSHASGHFRTCWDPDAPLDGAHMRTDCSGGRKAVMCVLDQANARDRNFSSTAFNPENLTIHNWTEEMKAADFGVTPTVAPTPSVP